MFHCCFVVHGQLKDLSQSDKIALWVVAATMTFAVITSLLGYVSLVSLPGLSTSRIRTPQM